MTETNRESLADDQGRPVLTYVRSTRDGLPLADLVETSPGVDVDDAADLAILAFPGWAFSATPELGTRLIDRGAAHMRHAHWLSRDLVADPPDAEWAALVPSNPAHVLGSARRDPADYVATFEAAYPPGHLDHELHATTEDLIAQDVLPLLDGTHGALLDASGVVLEAGLVVAACLVGDRTSVGPWVNDVSRRPGAAYRGLGALLLRRMIAHLAADGFPQVGLTVTDGNPARATYDRLGFRPVLESLTVRLPVVS